MRLRIEKVVHRGLGLGRVDGRVWLVPLAAPGDLVEARPVREKRSLVEGVVDAVLEPGPDRVDPPCTLFGLCGGCHLQHLSYPAQVAAKAAVLVDSLKRLGRIDAPEPEVATGDPWAYRSRIELHGRGSHVGFFARASQELVDVKRCPIAQPAIDRLAAPTAAAARDPVPAGPWEVEWVSDGKGGAVGLLVADFAGALAGALAALPGVSGLAVRRRSGHAWTAVAGATRVSWTTAGPQGPIRLESEARDFSQANAGLNPALVAKVLELASPHPGERTFEPYAGAGNLTIPLLLAGADVTSAEIAREAVADARAAADALGLRGTFLAGDATAHARRLAARGERFDLLVADPPRTGLSDPAALAGLAASRIVLVSCEPSALARDVASLASAGYRLDRLALVDMFPQTFHVEAVARLERR